MEGGKGWALIYFSQIVAWHDHFLNASSARKQQHKLLIYMKSWSETLNRGTFSICNFFPNLTCSQFETTHKSNNTRRKLYILCCFITRPQNAWGEGRGAYSRGGGAYFKFWPIGRALIPRGRLFEGALIGGFTVGNGTITLRKAIWVKTLQKKLKFSDCRKIVRSKFGQVVKESLGVRFGW